jgi:hypothetical protein
LPEGDVAKKESGLSTTGGPPPEKPDVSRNSPWRLSPAAKPPLRVGLLLDSSVLPRFNVRIIEDLRSSNFVDLALLVYKKDSTLQKTTAPQGLAGRVARRIFDSKLRKHTLYDFYLRFDQRNRGHDDPLENLDCSGLLSGIESIEVEPIGAKFVHRFPSEALDRIKAKNLDVLIRFGFNILKGEILTAARFGVWSYHHGDNEFYRGGPPLFWELYERSPLSGVLLQVLTEELDAGIVLCKSLFATKATLSVSENRVAPYSGSTDLVIRKLNELHQFGWEHLLRNAVPPAPYRGKRKLYRSPTNSDMARWLGPVLLEKAMGRPFRRRSVQHWKIAIRLNSRPLFDAASDNSFQGFRWIEPQKGHFWADPFLLEHEGRRWVFFEDYVYARRRAFIACAELAADGKLVSPVPCMSSPEHHYSYPYVFRDGEELFMIPEAHDTGSIVLYRCDKFPDSWIFQETLLIGKFVDTSVWRHNGLWWMMTTRADPDSRSACLFLFYAERLTGNWRFHPANPISTDVRNNRGAGRIFYTKGRLIRPSQSCSPVYGYSFTLNEITSLSATEYSEQALREFRPEPLNMQATHTYNWLPGVEIIDGASVVPLRKV